MRGDRVATVVVAGDPARTGEAVASGAGRGVETAVRRGVVEVREVTRNGTLVRTARCTATRVPAPVEQPVPRGAAAERPLRDDPEVQRRLSTLRSTPPVGRHPPGGPSIGTRA
ncbi:hypothetical protein [Streptomyces sp. NPDC050856]|uniref:hypothetical protein n=1 Tax=Streptomyces sp. NPDC050856 TaxID=3154939 RepID=UPI0033E58ABF